ncbi:aldehyde dehydrogenase family protein [Mariprofundus erugo]|uniref:proline dehydrogenase family protein n=1 Tax=Mariprofundus erugo TaxID=2528639 RepID=UPI0010FE6753|nr:proline dehydrogenase family protein [Mariprofundus erugo]TLS74556.1 aldehyde dehydrogenase family protein [Mariprofundus erugo]
MLPSPEQDHSAGGEFLHRLETEPPHGSRVEQHLLQLAAAACQNRELLTAILRFVDVLPALESNRAIAEHLGRYFAHISTPLPPLLKRILRHADHGLLPLLTAPLVRTLAGQLGQRFIACSNAQQALATLTRLHQNGRQCSLDLLGEQVLSEQEADHHAAQYLSLIQTLAPELTRSGIPLHLSLKVSSFDSQLSPEAASASVARIVTRLTPIVAAVRAHGGVLILDMEHYETREITLSVLRTLLTQFTGFHGLGIAMQAYLIDCEEELTRLIDWAETGNHRLHIRLVRGAYWDREVTVAIQNGWPIPVWPDKAQTDASFARCLKLLMSRHPVVHPAIATHNRASIALALELIRSHHLARDAYEFQMLYGMGEQIQHVLVAMQQPLTIYTPVGEIVPGMAYLVRRILENSANESLLSDILRTEESPHRETDTAAPKTGLFARQPPWRFCSESERTGLGVAIRNLHADAGWHRPMLIDGCAVQSDRQIVSRNPSAPDEMIGTVAAATLRHADLAVEAATAALPGWSAERVEVRAGILRRAATLFAAQRLQLTALEILEAGKTWREADADVCEAIDFLHYYADCAESMAAGHCFDVIGERNRYQYRPCGVAAIIPPWNFPLAIATGMTAAALVTGNTVVLKPASDTPLLAGELVQLLHQAGVPGGALHYLPGHGSEVGEHLVKHPDIHLIAFTGSLEVGLHINQVAAEQAATCAHIKRIICELGGKNAIIVDDDADIDAAIAGIMASAFGYSGQKCSACSRVIIVGHHYERVIERLALATGSLITGAAEQPETSLGPVISITAANRIRAVIEDARTRLRTVVIRQPPPGPCFVGPAIFADVPADDPLAQEEIFGPVLAITAAATFAEAIRLANHSRYALTGGVYSRHPEHLAMAEREFAAGNLYLNRTITGALVGRQPFGGFKLSGTGYKAGGPDYLLQYVQARHISENTTRHGFTPANRDH